MAYGSTNAPGKLTPSDIGAAPANHTHTPASIGAAAASHGTHVSYSTTAPVMDGAAAVGTASTVARSDHRHPTDTSRAPASHTHTKSQITDFPSSLPASDVYSWAKAASKPTYTASEVGAAASGHTHTAAQIGALPSTGGTLTGNLTIKGSGNYGTKINLGDGDYVHISEPKDDELEIKAKKINFVVSDTSSTGFTLNGAQIGATVGKSMAGQSVKPTSDTTVTAGTGAEIFNDYSVRSYSGVSISSGNVASGDYSHAEGYKTTASGQYSHAEGYYSDASGDYSHAEGKNLSARGESSHAEGYRAHAIGIYSHAEGCICIAEGMCSHAEGNSTAKSDYSHSEGQSEASARYQHTSGKYNVLYTDEATKLIIGKGTGNTARANCFRVTDIGTYAAGAYNASGADYAEYFSWLDGNPEREDRVGLFVTLDGEEIRLAGPEDDYILGIVSGNPSVVGDVHDDQWQGMYLHDIYGRPLWEDVEVPDETVEEPDPEDPEQTVTRIIRPAHVEHRQRLNPAYDGSKPYQARSDRPEWDAVGMLGKLVARDDGSCQVNGWCKPAVGGIATASQERTRFRVMARLDEEHIRVMVLA